LKKWRGREKLRKRTKYSYERFLYPSERELRKCREGVRIKYERVCPTYDHQILSMPFEDRSLADLQDLRYSQDLKKERAWENGEEVSSDGDEGLFLEILKQGSKYKRLPDGKRKYL
jgi:hypothetical protein